VWRTEVRACTCGREFRPRREGQRHCSRRCRVRSAVTRHRSDYKTAHPIAVGSDLFNLPGDRLEGSSPALRESPAVARADRLGREEFRWHGLALHLGQRKTPVLTLVADDTYPHLFRISYTDGWTSTPANMTRAKDAAYGHARWLLKESEGSGGKWHRVKIATSNKKYAT
jgi:hypothetical protein